MRKMIILFMFVLLCSVAYAEICEQKVNFLDRLKNGCRYDNQICEDAETPMNKDCALSIGSITCKEDRCIFKELWFAKLLFLALVLMVIFYKKDYNIFIMLIILCLVFNFIHTIQLEGIKDKLDNIVPAMNSTQGNAAHINQEQINNNLMLKYGQEVLPSNPIAGFIIILIGIFFILKYLFNKIGGGY